MDHAISEDLPSSIIANDTNTDPPPSNNKSPTGAMRRLRVTIIVASSLVVLGVIIGVLWRALQPSKPIIAVNLSLSNFNVSDTQLKSNSDILLIDIINSDRITNLVIDPFDVSVYYHDTQLSVATVPGPIYLQSMSQIRVKVELGVQDQSGHSKVAANPKPWDVTRLLSVGNGDFNVTTSVSTRFKALQHMLTWRMHFDVRCRISDMRVFNLDNTWEVSGFGYCDLK